jgi:S-layer protein
MARLTLNSGESVGLSSGTYNIFGTSAGKETVTIAAAATVTLDASFNAGGDTVTLAGNAADYTAVRSGSSLILTHTSGGVVTIPVGTTASTVAFADASRSLVFNTTSSAVELGSQAVTSTAAAVSAGTGGSAAGQTFTLTSGVDTVAGTAGDDTINASAASRLGAFDNLSGGAGTDTLQFVVLADGDTTTDDSFALNGSATFASVESLVLSHTSDKAGDTIALDTSNYSSLKSVSVAHIGLDVTSVTVTGDGNLTAVNINGGSGDDITAVSVSDAGDDGTATVATGDTLSSVTLAGVTGAGTLASDALTSLNINDVGGVVTNTDGYIAATDARALTVTYAGGTNGGVTDAGATSVTVKASAAVANIGTNTFTAATAVTLDNTGGGKILTGALATSAAKSVAVVADNAITLTGTVGGTSVTDLTISGDSLVTASGITTKTTGVVTINGSAGLTLAATIGTLTTGGSVVNNSTGTVTLGSGTTTAGIDTAVAYTGGAGADKLSIGATTKAITLGAGNDTLSMTGAAFGTGGSVDAGEGTADILAMTSANAATASSTAAFEAKISNFEIVSLGATAAAATDVVDVANLDDISTVRSAGVTAAGTLTVNNLQATNSFTLTGAAAGAVALNLATAVGTSDVANVTLSAAAGFANTAAVTIAGVETVNVTTSDTSVSTDLSPTITAFTAPIVATSATSVVVTGNAGLNLTGSTLLAVTSLDASAVTGFVAADGTNAAGTVTYATGAVTGSITVKGGAGDDVLNASAAATAGKTVTISGNDGADTITGSTTLANTLSGGAGADILVGGSAADTLDGGAGADTITLGGGLDVVTGGASADTFVVAAAGTTSAVYGRVTDAAAGDKISFGADQGTETFASTKISLAGTASFTDYLNAAGALDGSSNGKISWFQFGGNTYLVESRDADGVFTNATDILLQLDGLVNFTTAATLGVTDGNVLTIG